MFDIDVRVLSHLKEELARTADKQLQIISTIMLSVMHQCHFLAANPIPILFR